MRPQQATSDTVFNYTDFGGCWKNLPVCQSELKDVLLAVLSAPTLQHRDRRWPVWHLGSREQDVTWPNVGSENKCRHTTPTCAAHDPTDQGLQGPTQANRVGDRGRRSRRWNLGRALVSSEAVPSSPSPPVDVLPHRGRAQQTYCRLWWRSLLWAEEEACCGNCQVLVFFSKKVKNARPHYWVKTSQELRMLSRSVSVY